MTRFPFRYVVLSAGVVVASVFILAPLAIVIVASLSSVAYNVFPPPGLSLQWYENLFSHREFYGATVRSIVLATSASAVSVAFGTLAAYGISRYRLRGAGLLRAFFMSPIVLPKIVLGVALFIFFVRMRLLGHYSSVLLTHALVCLPFVVSLLLAAFASFDWSLQEAAMDLGAGPFYTFRRVIIPQIRIGLGMSAIFAFIISFDQVETTLFLVRPKDNTLPIEMFLYLQKWQDPTIAALSSILIVVSLIVVVVIGLVLRRGGGLEVLMRSRGGNGRELDGAGGQG